MVVNVVAMNGDLVANLPVTHCTAHAKNDARSIGTKNVIIEVVALCPAALAAKASQGAECADGLKNAAPHRIEVDARCHDGNDYFVGSQLWQGNLTDMDALARILLVAGHAIPHFFVFLADNRGTECGGEGYGREFFARGTVQDGCEDFFHLRNDSDRRPIIS